MFWSFLWILSGKINGNPELVLWLQIDDCCDMSLKCEFYLNLNVVTSKIMSYEQNKAASSTHQFPVAIETLSIPRSLCMSRPLSWSLCALAQTPNRSLWLHKHRSGLISPPSLSIPFPSQMWALAMGQVGELRLTQKPFSITLRSPPDDTAHDTPLIYPTHADLDGSFTVSDDCLIVSPDPVSPTLVTLCSECSGHLSQAQTWLHQSLLQTPLLLSYYLLKNFLPPQRGMHDPHHLAPSQCFSSTGPIPPRVEGTELHNTCPSTGGPFFLLIRGFAVCYLCLPFLPFPMLSVSFDCN